MRIPATDCCTGRALAPASALSIKTRLPPVYAFLPFCRALPINPEFCIRHRALGHVVRLCLFHTTLLMHWQRG